MTLTDTTAGLTRSAATTIAVRRELPSSADEGLPFRGLPFASAPQPQAIASNVP
jgi:hypothetical protein